jgi:hypothetical protein
MAPTAISPIARVRANTFGSSLPKTGYLALAMPWQRFRRLIVDVESRDAAVHHVGASGNP